MWGHELDMRAPRRSARKRTATRTTGARDWDVASANRGSADLLHVLDPGAVPGGGVPSDHSAQPPVVAGTNTKLVHSGLELQFRVHGPSASASMLELAPMHALAFG